MEKGEKKPEDKQADMLYFLMVLAAFIVAVMVMVSIYSDKGINIYVVPAAPKTENVAAPAAAGASGVTAVSEPEEYYEESSRAGAQEVLMEKSIDINHADEEELQKLPGIGPVLAERIIEYREGYGEFADIEEIMEVSGIGETIFAKIRDFIYVS